MILGGVKGVGRERSGVRVGGKVSLFVFVHGLEGEKGENGAMLVIMCKVEGVFG